MKSTHIPIQQRGVGTLLVSMALMLIMSLVVFYANRNVLFEQRTAANTARATEAMELAEGGIEWALGLLNDNRKIGLNCEPLSSPGNSDTTFRDRYLNPTSTTFVPLTGVTAGCKRSDNGVITCSCPTSGHASLGTTSERGFTVVFSAIAGQTNAVGITAYGCTPQANACREGQTSAADASAKVAAILKASPLLPGKPGAAITCATTCDLNGSFTVTNTDLETNGVLINAGGDIIYNPSSNTFNTIPGQPGTAALIKNDASLSALANADSTCNQSAMFLAYFGVTIDDFRRSPTTTTLTCATSNCNLTAEITTEYSKGNRAFYLPKNTTLNASATLGTLDKPVVLVAENGLAINGGFTLYGMVFSNDATFDTYGAGNSTVNGAVVSCSGFDSQGNGTIAYNPDVLNKLNTENGIIVRVPGSWRDW